jgi:CheY-like chemotaxis protein
MGGILASALELSETPLEPGQQQLVTTLQSCASYLASLVEDVLDFAAIEAGAYTVTRSGFSPREVLETVVKMLGSRAAPGAMSVAIDPELPERLIGDAGRVQQVMVNYAANSLKFGAQHVWLSARTDAGSVVYSVADDGIGVPADEQKNLFIRFSRLKSARNSAIPGTGLGLAVCRALAERMGGTVGFAPAPGGGSIFLLRLPIEAGEGGEVPLPSYEAQGMKALVVEDIEYNARALSLMLGRLGFGVTAAADGEEALRLLSSERFDAIFLDCDLPHVSGAEVARRFRLLESRGEHARIIATTALSSSGDRDACLAAGMDAFLTKPITPQKLLGILSAPGGAAAAQQALASDDSAKAPAPGVDLGMIAHLADGSAGSFGRELEKYFLALGQALAGVAAAHASGSRAAVATAAHRVLSLARMVGADSLSATAADVQDFANAFTDAELADEIETLGERGRALRDDLESLALELPLSSSRDA